MSSSAFVETPRPRRASEGTSTLSKASSTDSLSEASLEDSRENLTYSPSSLADREGFEGMEALASSDDLAAGLSPTPWVLPRASVSGTFAPSTPPLADRESFGGDRGRDRPSAEPRASPPSVAPSVADAPPTPRTPPVHRRLLDWLFSPASAASGRGRGSAASSSSSSSPRNGGAWRADWAPPRAETTPFACAHATFGFRATSCAPRRGLDDREDTARRPEISRDDFDSTE